MPALQFGLNVQKKGPGGPSKSAQASKASVFGEPESDDEDEAPVTANPLRNGLSIQRKKADTDKPPSSSADAAKKCFFDDPESEDGEANKDASAKPPAYGIQDSATPGKPGKTKVSLPQSTDLSTLRTQQRVQAEAEQLDPSIYDYDASYDALHAADAAKKAAAKADAAARKPRYMESLLAAAEVRKKDQLRAKDKAVQREREAEGEEFAEKEKFVTGAYKEQQEEVRRAAEEERKREEEEERNRKGKGMVGFYKAEMERRDREHAETLKAAEEIAANGGKTEDTEGEQQDQNEELQEKRDADKARELNAKGADIALDDEGNVIDKRQLLSAGLNIAPKPKSSSGTAVSASNVGQKPGARPNFHAENKSQREDRRQRETERLMRQLEAGEKRKAEEEEAERKEREEKAKSRKTTNEVMGARERYLARKKEAEAAKAKEKENETA